MLGLASEYFSMKAQSSEPVRVWLVMEQGPQAIEKYALGRIRQAGLGDSGFPFLETNHLDLHRSRGKLARRAFLLTFVNRSGTIPTGQTCAFICGRFRPLF